MGTTYSQIKNGRAINFNDKGRVEQSPQFTEVSTLLRHEEDYNVPLMQRGGALTQQFNNVQIVSNTYATSIKNQVQMCMSTDSTGEAREGIMECNAEVAALLVKPEEVTIQPVPLPDFQAEADRQTPPSSDKQLTLIPILSWDDAVRQGEMFSEWWANETTFAANWRAKNTIQMRTEYVISKNRDTYNQLCNDLGEEIVVASTWYPKLASTTIAYRAVRPDDSSKTRADIQLAFNKKQPVRTSLYNTGYGS